MKNLFEERKGEAETLAGFILEISGNFQQRDIKNKFSQLF
jgi:hypothetical protein